jgi:NADH-quinone oxidoreductase subunit L
MIDLAWLIPLFPLIGFAINGIVTRRFPEKVIGWIGALAIGASFVVAVLIFLELLRMAPDARSIEKVVYTWIASGTFSVQIAFLIDPLSTVMLLVVTCILSDTCTVKWASAGTLPT